jgi:hypothetical protein
MFGAIGSGVSPSIIGWLKVQTGSLYPGSGGYWGYTSRWCCFGADRHAEALGGDGRLTCSPVINSEGPSRDDCNPR